MAKQERVKICLLKADTNDKEFFSASDIGYHPRLTKEREMLSIALVNAALTWTMNNSCLDKIRVARKEDEMWQERGPELLTLGGCGKNDAGRNDRIGRVTILHKSFIHPRKEILSNGDSPRLSRFDSSRTLRTGKND